MSEDLQFLLGVSAVMFAYFAGKALIVYAQRKRRSDDSGND